MVQFGSLEESLTLPSNPTIFPVSPKKAIRWYTVTKSAGKSLSPEIGDKK